jgi:hypothetical protein
MSSVIVLTVAFSHVSLTIFSTAGEKTSISPWMPMVRRIFIHQAPINRKPFGSTHLMSMKKKASYGKTFVPYEYTQWESNGRFTVSYNKALFKENA